MRVAMLNLGWMSAPAGLWRQGDEEPERPLRLPVPAYLIEMEDERILVDTGLHPDAVTDPDGRYGEGNTLTYFGLEQDAGLAEQIDLATITRVVLTHLHFDHAGGLALIPKSVPVVLQRAEWEAGQDRTGIERNFFQPRDYADAPANLVLLEGDHDLLGDGSIELLSTPGHTVGHQSVRIGDLVLGADVALFASGLDDHRFPAFGYSQEEAVGSAERLRQLRDAGLTIQPGHDPDVLQPGPLAA
jgi:glyoxylase-like metal-dependent hydrolase (beta-lactamase superfamily II)